LEIIGENIVKENNTFYSYFKSPLGRLILTSDGTYLTGLLTGKPDEPPSPNKSWILDDDVAPFSIAKEQLTAYFKKQLKRFDFPVKLDGTDFQKAVWKQLQRIPYGEVISYGEQARRLGKPKASRAVGSANGRNPLAIIVPCHRVITSSGKLGGYTGGLSRKEYLLALENE
jgi:methylated-DNA-[protein]-cysteine S-methyltransferase